ncbi:MAG TPA: hypothetical protein VJ824_16020, partial [Bacillota bacterium]|nr:hypothetical protein [Bacillota bacterium]
MRGTTHTIISALGGLELGLITHADPLPMASGIVLAALAGKIVDIDEPNSSISRTISPPAGILRIAFFLIAACVGYYLYTHPGINESYLIIGYVVCGLIGCLSLMGGDGLFRRIGISLFTLTISYFVWKQGYSIPYVTPGIVFAVIAWLPHRWAVH